MKQASPDKTDLRSLYELVGSEAGTQQCVYGLHFVGFRLATIRRFK